MLRRRKDGPQTASQPSTINHQLFGGSDWAQLEAGTFRFRAPLNKERRFIPLRFDDASIKGSLAQFLYINWLAGRNAVSLSSSEEERGKQPHIRRAAELTPIPQCRSAEHDTLQTRFQIPNGIGQCPCYDAPARWIPSFSISS